jgi:Calcineurin-like phosphoesterase
VTVASPRTIAKLIEGRQGLRVVGDAHAQSGMLRDAIADARARDLAILLLGDLIDRGPDAAGTIRLMLDLWERGDGDLIPGNHDDKFRRWIAGRRVELESSGLGRTLEQIAADPDSASITRAYAEGVARRPLWRRAGDWFFVHGGFHPAMLRQDEGPPAADKEKAGWLASRALYGETDGTKRPDGYPVRTYRWIDLVPAKIKVVIGHDVVSTDEIVRRRGARGGEIVHLDTGADRGGRLSWIDIPTRELSRD